MLAFFGLGALGGAGVLALARRHVLSRCGHRLRDADFCYCALRAGAFAFTRSGIGLFRRRRAGMDQHSGYAQYLQRRQQLRAWVRARVISMYVLVLQGGLALGSAVWGVVASNAGLHFTLTFAAIALAAGLFISPWYRLQQSPIHK